MFLENLRPYEIILGSQSPRRQELLRELGIQFKVQSMNVEENFPSSLDIHEVPVYLAELKASAFVPQLKSNQLIITADTIVCLDGQVMNKPTDYQDAFRMLTALSGKKHQVISGVCLLSTQKKISFSATTEVWFKPLTDHEIHYYIENFKPYDKAGAYGIQEWIGYIGIHHIEGSYHNVMGLPVKFLYEHLRNF